MVQTIRLFYAANNGLNIVSGARPYNATASYGETLFRNDFPAQIAFQLRNVRNVSECVISQDGENRHPEAHLLNYRNLVVLYGHYGFVISQI